MLLLRYVEVKYYEKSITCYIEMSIAGSFSYFVRDDALVDTTMGMAHRADDQVVDISNCREVMNGAG